VANIPYNITGAILEKFLSAEHQPRSMVLLVQKEVAERIVGYRRHRVSTVGTKESILSISVKAYGTPSYVETVLAGSFAPAPKVDSAIIKIEGISKDFFANFTEKAFFTLLQAGFQSKRKKLSSNLSKIYPKETVLEAFQKLELDENTRAEDVALQIWKKLAEDLFL
jgi:16S rRNA (adenine1518-N6/adenine1519-N6)-dimethyltransferase